MKQSFYNIFIPDKNKVLCFSNDKKITWYFFLSLHETI